MKIHDNARRLARKDGMKDVYIAPDMTRKQREEARREEKLRADATSKTEEAKNEGLKGKWVVVVGRGVYQGASGASMDAPGVGL